MVECVKNDMRKMLISDTRSYLKKKDSGQCPRNNSCWKMSVTWD